MFIRPLSAVTRSGSASAKAPNSSGITKWPMVCRPADGEGGTALRMQPTGAATVMGCVAPSLLGSLGVVRHFTV